MPSLLQLVARSICRGNRCLSLGLDNSERFANPPWNLILRVLMSAQFQGADIILVPQCGNHSHGTPSCCQCWWTSHTHCPTRHNNGVSANSAPTAWLCGTSQGKSQQTRPFRSGCRPHPQIMKDENEKVLQCIVWAMESLVC